MNQIAEILSGNNELVNFIKNDLELFEKNCKINYKYLEINSNICLSINVSNFAGFISEISRCPNFYFDFNLNVKLINSGISVSCESAVPFNDVCNMCIFPSKIRGSFLTYIKSKMCIGYHIITNKRLEDALNDYNNKKYYSFSISIEINVDSQNGVQSKYRHLERIANDFHYHSIDTKLIQTI